MRYDNCAPRTIEQFGTDPEHIIVKRPGLTLATPTYPTTNPTYYRGIGQAHGLTYFACDNKVWGETGGYILTLHATDIYASPVWFAEVTLAGVKYLAVLEEEVLQNSHLHIHNVAAQTTTTIDIGFVSTGPLVFLNGYLFTAKKDSQTIYNSEVGSLTTWTIANNFIDAEMHGDDIKALAIHRNHLVALGSSSIEFFYDGAVEVGSPLVRQESYSTQVGMLAAGTLQREHRFCYIGNDFYFYGAVGKTRGLYKLSNFKVERITDDYIDMLINSSNHYGNFISGSLYLFVINYQGELCPVISMEYYNTNFAVVRYTFVYHPKEKVFSQLSISTIEDNQVNVGAMKAGVSGDFLLNFLGGVIRGWHVSLDNKKPVTASWTTDFFDGGVDSMKHFKYVDVLGSIGDIEATNTITLSYCKDYTPVTFTNATTISRAADQFYTTRFRNLGRARRISLRVTATGSAPMAIKGLDIAYNLGVY
jgi:hypothetical protein